MAEWINADDDAIMFLLSAFANNMSRQGPLFREPALVILCLMDSFWKIIKLAASFFL